MSKINQYVNQLPCLGDALSKEECRFSSYYFITNIINNRLNIFAKILLSSRFTGRVTFVRRQRDATDR